MGKTSKTGYPQKENPALLTLLTLFLKKSLKPLLTLFVSGTLIACGTLKNQQDTVPDCPGLSARDRQVEVCVTVPGHEPESIGTLQITLHSALHYPLHNKSKQQNLELERDGSLERLWLLPEPSGYPVVILLTRSVGSGSYPDLQGLQRVNDEYQPFKLAGLSEQQRLGYMGHDQFQVMAGQLYRRFPIYRQTDANISPSGGQACYYYDLKKVAWLQCPD
ncbi:hypothetical protein [Endozoicomonas sp.]|uniref:hypothetical protein n=1 Tax=Endozoicomonas sp. TaxID=1892382 RepID=UPI00383A1C8F